MFLIGLHAGSVGGGSGSYYSNRGEVLVWRRCPRDFGFYVMDDDVSAGVMQAGHWMDLGVPNMETLNLCFGLL